MCSTARYAQNLSITASKVHWFKKKQQKRIFLKYFQTCCQLFRVICAVTQPWKIRCRSRLFINIFGFLPKYQQYQQALTKTVEQWCGLIKVILGSLFFSNLGPILVSIKKFWGPLFILAQWEDLAVCEILWSNSSWLGGGLVLNLSTNKGWAWIISKNSTFKGS